MKILLISNSFGVNLQKYAKEIANANNFEVDIYTLYIGGCSLETHDKNIKENNKNYELFCNGKSLGKYVSINEFIDTEKWDYISLQQASHFSGNFSSYFPYIKSVCAFVRKRCPNSKIIFHKTWAYSGRNLFKYEEVKSWESSFNFKNNIEMENGIKKAVKFLQKEEKFEFILDSGAVVFEGEKYFLNIFDEQGFHLNNLGCYLIGLNLIKELRKQQIKNVFVPDEIDENTCIKMVNFINERF